MRKHLTLLMSIMALQFSLAQNSIDSVEVKFQSYLTKVDEKDSIVFERIKKELELPIAKSSLEILKFADTIDPNANWKLVGRKVETWGSSIHDDRIIRDETFNPLSLYSKKTRLEKKVFSSEFIFNAFMIKKINDFEDYKRSTFFLPQISNSWIPFFYKDYLILKIHEEYFGHSYSGGSNEFYYFRKVE